ncbi:hypothetical protein DF032_09225 [Burkholderia seminalis]|nr:hypothetical protein DF032_09225 [Burkholderia seminalis]
MRMTRNRARYAACRFGHGQATRCFAIRTSGAGTSAFSRARAAAAGLPFHRTRSAPPRPALDSRAARSIRAGRTGRDERRSRQSSKVP